MKRNSDFKQKLKSARESYETIGICCCPMCGRELNRDVGDLCICGFDLSLGRQDTTLFKNVVNMVAGIVVGLIVGILKAPLLMLQLWIEEELGIELSELIYLIIYIVLLIVILGPIIIFYILIHYY